MEAREIEIRKIVKPWVFALLLLTQNFCFFAPADAGEEGKKKIVYEKNTKLDFEGLNLEGELKNPAEFYFQHRSPEKFDSLLKKRNNFHREMLRDAVMSK